MFCCNSKTSILTLLTEATSAAAIGPEKAEPDHDSCHNSDNVTCAHNDLWLQITSRYPFRAQGVISQTSCQIGAS